ncbi:MAG: ligB [Neobacillus sp.]|jgi:DNA ligase-1|nr:ligB [Neobacillus sp.]
MYVRPMLLSETEEPFDDSDWLTELKFDGIRLICSTFGETRLYSRHKKEWTAAFPELLNVHLPKGTILDGELIAPDSAGRSDFERLLQRMHSSRQTDISVLYCVFDVLYERGQSVMDRPLIQRKEILSELLLGEQEHFLQVPYLFGHAVSYFQGVKAACLEGIVQKKKNSLYRSARTNNWLKVVAYQHEDVQIVGLLKGSPGILLTFLDGQPAGALLSLKNQDKMQFYKKMEVIKETDTFKQIRPILCRVKYRMKTKHGKLRLPVFDRFLD